MTESDIFNVRWVYESSLGALSVLIAVLVAWTIFDLSARLFDSRGPAKAIRLGIGALSIGFAVWSMQYVGMHSLPTNASLFYDWPTTFLSLLASVIGSAIVLLIVSQRVMSIPATSVGSILAGISYITMHSIGIQALRVGGVFTLSYPLLALAIILSIVIAFTAIWLAFALRSRGNGWDWAKLVCSIVIGLAISILHSVAMAAISLTPAPAMNLNMQHAILISSLGRESLALIAITILACVLVTLMIDRRVSQYSLELQLSEDRHKAMLAIAAQRVTRLENDALTEEIQERKRVEATLHHVAFHDSLTGLHNRVYFMDKLTIALKGIQDRDKVRSAVIYIDLDNFKAVNDMLGHRMGDLLLQEIAQRLSRCLREQDTLARMGGDEFTLLFCNFQTIEQPFRMTQRLLSVIEEPLTLAGMLLPITASMGLCEITANYTEAEEILRDADTAMYRAKREGGARCVIYDTSMHDEALSALQAKLRLKTAVENQEFALYYQPLVNLQDTSIHGMEALIRWNHPVRGLLGPDKFIQLAEETGHIIAIGSWVLRQACSDFKQFQQSSTKELLLSVNVSSRQLEEETFLTELKNVIEESGINPRFLQLEITESIFLKDANRIGMLFKEIRSLGVRIAFDDFGTGYSSLSYLEKYPIDTLKIDQSFVQHMGKGSVNADIVQLTIKLAEATGMSVSAEGVEEPEQAADLLKYGCSVAQGYLYSRPVSLEAMTSLLAHGLNSQESSVSS